MNRQVPYVIFTDLDGTLLDQESHSPHGAEQALERLQAHKVPLVFCTSQTRAEVEAVRSDLGNQDPFIVENGAAIFIPQDYFPFSISRGSCAGGYHVIELGVPYIQTVAALHHAASLSGCEVRAFNDLSVAQVALRCHMSLSAAERAKRREYDEPFEVLSENAAVIFSLFERLEQAGLTWTREGRFYHVRGRHNKGEAAGILISLYRQWCPEVITVGLGDGPNDLSLLEAVNVPIVIPSRHGQRSTAPQKRLGPKAWNRAVLDVLEGPGVLSKAAAL